jgi:AcrR family transcriptional regulator
MARARSPEKHNALLDAATSVIADQGTSASTARIAKLAGVAEGTLFTYFPTKDALFNAVYLKLKRDVYAHMFDNFPLGASLELRTRHVWTTYLLWMANNPTQHRAIGQLKVSDIITPETRAEATNNRTEIDTFITDLAKRTGTRNLSPDFIAALMLSMQEATADFLLRYPRQRKHYIESGFTTFWRAIR